MVEDIEGMVRGEAVGVLDWGIVGGWRVVEVEHSVCVLFTWSSRQVMEEGFLVEYAGGDGTTVYEVLPDTKGKWYWSPGIKTRVKNGG
jgi:hypothetical protein